MLSCVRPCVCVAAAPNLTVCECAGTHTHAQCFDCALADASCTEEALARMCGVIASAEKCLLDGASEHLQLLHVATSCARVLVSSPTTIN